jgi:hypothetical protein
MPKWVGSVGAVTIGALGWTAAEYGLHRFAMHELRGKGLASREHLSHHADVTYFSPSSKKALAALGYTVAVLPVATRLVGRRRAIEFTAGFDAMYLSYEVLHRRTHTHPPRNAYGRWMRKSHFHHHFGSPMRNHGVTTPWYDKLMGTYDDPGLVTVPRRMAPVWMLDDEGDVKAEYAGDYLAKGNPARDVEQDERDRRDAFANTAPELV